MTHWPILAAALLAAGCLTMAHAKSNICCFTMMYASLHHGWITNEVPLSKENERRTGKADDVTCFLSTWDGASSSPEKYTLGWMFLPRADGWCHSEDTPPQNLFGWK